MYLHYLYKWHTLRSIVIIVHSILQRENNLSMKPPTLCPLFRGSTLYYTSLSYIPPSCISCRSSHESDRAGEDSRPFRQDGYIDLSEISSILRGLRRARSLAKKQPISDSEKIDYEVAITELLLQLSALFMSSQMKFQTALGSIYEQ